MKKSIYIIVTVLLMVWISSISLLAETIKLGLPEYGWAGLSYTVMEETNDIHSARFTALENITVDRVMQYFRYLDSTDTRLRIGIQSDNAGSPSGTWLNSAVIDPAEGDSRDFALFGSVSLTSGTVYHVVTEFETLGSGESFRLYNASSTYNTRAFDRRLDANRVVVSSNSGSSWYEANRNPIYIFANGSDTNIIQGPGNPYMGFRQASTFSSRGGVAGVKGTRWYFAGYESAGYASMIVTNININIMAATGAAAPTNALIIRVRESDGTILASATVPTNAVAGFKSYELDSEITLSKDTPYLITTEFSDNGGTSSQYYYIYAIYAFDNVNYSPTFAQAGYGGTNSVVPIVSTDGWATFANGYEAWDIPFWFDAETVEPPPAGTVITID